MSRPSGEVLKRLRSAYSEVRDVQLLFAEIDALQAELADSNLAFNAANEMNGKLEAELDVARAETQQQRKALEDTLLVSCEVTQKRDQLRRELAETVTITIPNIKSQAEERIADLENQLAEVMAAYTVMQKKYESAEETGLTLVQEKLDLRATQSQLVDALEWIKKYSATVGPFGCAVYDKADGAITAAKSMDVKS